MIEETMTVEEIAREKDSVGDFTFPERNKFDSGFGLSAKTIDYICDVKGDPDWVREFVDQRPGLSNLSRREALRLMQAV